MTKKYNLGPDKPDCVFEGCERPQYAYELCASHNRQRRRGKELSPLRSNGRALKMCAVCDDGTPSALSSSGEPLCRKHHSRWVRYGNARALSRNEVRAKAVEVLTKMIRDRDRSSCWTDWADWPVWAEIQGGFGGAVTVGYPTVGSTRVMHIALELDGRPQPEAPANHGLHSCANKLCLNPDHLRWGTHQDNMMDLQAERGYCQHCSHCNP